MDVEFETVTPPPESNGSEPTAGDTEWRIDKTGKQYIPRASGGQRGRGIIYREGQETPDEARARDAMPREKRPQKPKGKPKMPDAPRKLESKELEESLAAALKAPGALAMSFTQDDWLPGHFNVAGPYLARHIILASEHNPWLRRRIEEAAQGQDAMWAVISLIGVGGAVIAYAVPPVVYMFNLPVPETARARWGMPPREPKPPYAAADAPGAETPEQHSFAA